MLMKKRDQEGHTDSKPSWEMVSVLRVNATLSFPRVCLMFAVLRQMSNLVGFFLVCLIFTNTAVPPTRGLQRLLQLSFCSGEKQQ